MLQAKIIPEQPIIAQSPDLSSHEILPNPYNPFGLIHFEDWA